MVANAMAIPTNFATPVVAVLDTGIDYTHPDLYLNIWINQALIPNSWKVYNPADHSYDLTAFKSQIVDVDSSGLIDFTNINAPVNRHLFTDNNGNGYIDAGDLLQPTTVGGWENPANVQTVTGINGHPVTIDTSMNDAFFGWNFAGTVNVPATPSPMATTTRWTTTTTARLWPAAWPPSAITAWAWRA